jgi:hypothetical protein
VFVPQLPDEAPGTTRFLPAGRGVSAALQAKSPAVLDPAPLSKPGHLAGIVAHLAAIAVFGAMTAGIFYD